MTLDDALAGTPIEKREAAISAVQGVCGRVTGVEAVLGGASGATILRIDGGARRYLLRVEGPDHPMLRRNPHRFTAERAAAKAGVAPAVHHIDEAAGVAISDFIERRPLVEFPGGREGLANASGALLARLQALPAFPSLIDYADLVEGMLKHVASSGLFASGALDRHFARLASVRTALADSVVCVASHNDPNPRNILYDGERLWLIDWESAYGNRPAFDAAIMVDNLADTPALEAAFVEGWRGRALAKAERRALCASQALTRLYYGCFVLQAAMGAPRTETEDTAAMAPLDLRLALESGALKPMTPPTAVLLGKVLLQAFLTDAPVTSIGEIMALAMFGPGAGLDGL